FEKSSKAFNLYLLPIHRPFRANSELIKFTYKVDQYAKPLGGGRFKNYFIRVPLKLKAISKFSITSLREKSLPEICSTFIKGYFDIL
ncbi:hypothetical protein HMI55_004858, partial [Coelomomyces lativittatus]